MPKNHMIVEQRIKNGKVYAAITRYNGTYYLFSVSDGKWKKEKSGKTPEKF